uniref:Uncharacterized protein n=1 Tax=Anopheles minimus TaxID=112268 RepID=A0A182WFC8_9DIPT
MGVRHLQTFMDRKVKNGTYSIRMDREIRNAKKSTENPLVVVDLMALFGLFCDDRRGLLCGSQERQHMTVVVKRNHHESHTFVTVPVIFPTAITPPQMKDLISKDATMQTSLLQRKLQLLRWVCSDDLIDREEFNAIPSSLLLTVLVLYRLRQYGAIRMFEADLLLLIAHQVTMGLFDPAGEPYPQRLISRAFRLGFLFQKLYAHFARVAKSLGVPEEYRPSTPYDGLRFHNHYRLPGA